MNDKKIGVYTFCTRDVQHSYSYAADSLKNYYKKHDIEVHHTDDAPGGEIGKTYELLKAENVRGIKYEPWYAAVLARLSLLSTFLESDAEVFIMQDLDYILLRPDLNIREKIDHSFIASYWSLDYWKWGEPEYHATDFYQPERAGYYSQKYHNTKLMMCGKDGVARGDVNKLSLFCADFMVMDRTVVENFIKFCLDRDCDLASPESINRYCKLIAHRCKKQTGKSLTEQVQMQEEELFAAYIEVTNDIPTPLNDISGLKKDFWCLRENENWIESMCQFIEVLHLDNNYIFGHLGSCDKVKVFPRISKAFQC